MTLDGENDPDAVFIFQVDAALNTAAASQVTLINGAQASNVYWQVLGATGIGANSTFSGTILGAGDITIGDSTQLIGRALSQGLVTLANNTIRFTSALPPTITITGGSTAVTKDTTPTIAGTTSAATGRTVTVTIAGQELTTAVLGDGTWSVTAAELAAGSYPVVATVRDAAGNAGAASQTLTVEVNPDPVDIGTTAPFSVLGATGVTSTGLTTVSGDLGSSPSTAIVGFPPGVVAGTVHAGDPTAAQAQTDLTAAYDDADNRIPHTEFSGDNNARTFRAGVHHTAAAFALTGTMTLDGENDPNAVFIFQVDAALNTAAASQVTLINGAQASNVYWQVLGATGIGANSTFSGTILGAGDITIGDSTELIGRALSQGLVTLANNTIRFTSAPPPTITITGGSTAVTKDTTPTIAGTTSAATGRTVTVTIAGQELTTAVLGDGTWSVTAAELVAGSYPVVATVRDAAGNAGAASQTLTVEVNPDPVDIGTTAPFSALGATGVTSTGLTTVSGDLGSSPSTAIVGFPPGVVAGTVHAGDPTAAQAQTDLTAAYDDADNRIPHTEFSGDNNARTFRAGVHHTAAAFALTGTMTLDGENDPNAVFIFQVDAALNTAAASQVTLINGAQASNVYWQVLGATGLGANSTFSGTILGAGDITIGDSTELIGRALSQGLVTLANNTIRFTSAPPPTITITGGSTAVTKDTTPTIAGTTSAATGRTVTVTIAGQELTTAVLGDGTWSVTAAELVAGSYPVVATVRDAAGNAGAASQTLTVEVNPDPVDIGTTAPFSALGATGVTSTGLTTVSGDLGSSPSTAIVGFPPGVVAGTVHAGDPTAAQAQTDLTAAYDDADNRIPHTEFSGDNNARTFRAGVHHTAAAFALTGTMTLDGENDPNAVFIFQVDAALNTAAASQVTLINGAQASNVYWQVLGATGLGANSTFSGTILGAGDITIGDSTELIGRALSQGLVTLANNTIRFVA